uniref:BURP domain-containing protein n=1 Tax=Oryza brachyantha TaxID=4533 RepID=J3MYF6_ORYBR
MRCASVLLLLLLSLSALSASTAEANEERLSRDNAAPSMGRKWLRGRKATAMAMATAAGRGHGDVVVEGKGGGEKKNTGANTAHAHGSERAVEVTVVGLSERAAASTGLPASCRSVPITALRELIRQGITDRNKKAKASSWFLPLLVITRTNLKSASASVFSTLLL